jgi:hypothetical protein
MAAVEASNALRIRMAFPLCLELVEWDRAVPDLWELMGLGHLPGRAGKTFLDDLPSSA